MRAMRKSLSLAALVAAALPDHLLTGSQREDAPIGVKFVTAPDTAVDLSTLRRLPGASVGGWGIHLDGGILPAGEHQIRVAFHALKGRAIEVIETIRITQAARSM
jgi:hypothetical protein